MNSRESRGISLLTVGDEMEGMRSYDGKRKNFKSVIEPPIPIGRADDYIKRPNDGWTT
jgi:hypothetical protein